MNDTKKKMELSATCSECGKYLERLFWNTTGDYAICINYKCTRYHSGIVIAKYKEEGKL